MPGCPRARSFLAVPDPLPLLSGAEASSSASVVAYIWGPDGVVPYMGPAEYALPQYIGHA